MRIEQNTGVQGVESPRVGRVQGLEETRPAAADTVEFSQQAADIRAAMESLRDAPVIREEQVAELRRQFEQGTLRVNVEALVEALLSGPR
jgi:flagellar biosynthesis anti-sigma factor FlgM